MAGQLLGFSYSKSAPAYLIIGDIIYLLYSGMSPAFQKRFINN